MANKKEYTGLEELQEEVAVEEKQAKDPVNVLDLLLGSDIGTIRGSM